MQLRRTCLGLLVCVCAVSLCVAPCTALPVPPPPAARLASGELGLPRSRVTRSPESLCPPGWDHMSCFHVYLRMYARLHDEAHRDIDDVSVRGIGKRVSSPSDLSLCPKWMAENECRTLNFVLSSFFDEDLS